ncbi:MAG: ABC transporter substrate-binding protein [SAR324 cluster bacterium]|nr:ABC transporter substrate-binding protein [SAR324 cluster bacterium]
MRKLFAIFTVFCFFWTTGINAEDEKPEEEKKDDQIIIGSTNPFTGPAAAYSTISNSILAYFNKVNDAGGIEGREINFISLDDGYSPPKTQEQFRNLVENEKILFIFQSFGTPTNSAVHRYINKAKIPHLFVASADSKWDNPRRFPWTMGWQPNYHSEGVIFAKYILKNHPDGKIAILYQNDDYGKQYLAGFKQELGEKFERMVLAEESYETDDFSVDTQVSKLKETGANILFNTAIPQFAIQAIKKIHELEWKPVHLLTAAASSIETVLKPAGFDLSQGIITTRYLLDPDDPKHEAKEGIIQFKAFMERYYPEGDRKSIFNLYGYAVAQTMVHVLENCKNDLSRENLMKQAASISKLEVFGLIPGITISTSPTDFRPIESMEMIQFSGEGYQTVGNEPIKGGNDLMN